MKKSNYKNFIVLQISFFPLYYANMTGLFTCQLYFFNKKRPFGVASTLYNAG